MCCIDGITTRIPDVPFPAGSWLTRKSINLNDFCHSIGSWRDCWHAHYCSFHCCIISDNEVAILHTDHKRYNNTNYFCSTLFGKRKGNTYISSTFTYILLVTVRTGLMFITFELFKKIIFLLLLNVIRIVFESKNRVSVE